MIDFRYHQINFRRIVMLTVEQTDFYEQNGYLMVEDVITKDQLNKLQDITYDFI